MSASRVWAASGTTRREQRDQASAIGFIGHDIARPRWQRNFFHHGRSSDGLSLKGIPPWPISFTTDEFTSQDLRAHEQTFHSFSKLVLFAILHIMLVLCCLALAFLGNAPLIATLIAGVGGTVAAAGALRHRLTSPDPAPQSSVTR